MIYSLRGTLLAVTTSEAVVECAGVGYQCFVSSMTINRLPAIGKEIMLYTYMSVREGAIDLFGFLSQTEQKCFKLLTSVSGVGPKMGLAILSQLTPDQVMLSIVTSDVKSLTRAAGVGPKLAQRIILELKDKVKNEDLNSEIAAAGDSVQQAMSGGNLGEAMIALEALGYSQSEAAKAVSGVSADQPVQEIIKIALKKIAQRK